LTGVSSRLTDYVQITSTSSNSALRINFSGGANQYQDMVITLAGAHFTQADIYDLVEGGNLLTGDKVLPPRVNIFASVPNASENGPVAGEFTLTRGGPATSELSVDLAISGSAANGVDYQFVPARATFWPDNGRSKFRLFRMLMRSQNYPKSSRSRSNRPTDMFGY